MTTWAILGAHGMLGTDLVELLTERNAAVRALGSGDADLRDQSALLTALAGSDVVVNCAAYTRVDDAEADEAAAFAINAIGAANAASAAVCSARFVHISTDYVMAGTDAGPYPEDATLAPRSAYGRTKAAGEWAVRASHPSPLIVRTAWLYGAHGPNFVATMLRLAQTHEILSVVDDQHGQPTWTADLADLIVRLVEADAPAGVYHGTSEGETTWCGLARAAFEESGLDPARVRPVTTDKFPRPAPRPANSVLSHEALRRIGVEPIRNWRQALHDAMPRLTL